MTYLSSRRPTKTISDTSTPSSNAYVTTNFLSAPISVPSFYRVWNSLDMLLTSTEYMFSLPRSLQSPTGQSHSPSTSFNSSLDSPTTTDASSNPTPRLLNPSRSYYKVLQSPSFSPTKPNPPSEDSRPSSPLRPSFTSLIRLYLPESLLIQATLLQEPYWSRSLLAN